MKNICIKKHNADGIWHPTICIRESYSVTDYLGIPVFRTLKEAVDAATKLSIEKNIPVFCSTAYMNRTECIKANIGFLTN